MTSAFRRHCAVGVSVAAHLTVLAMIVFHNPRVIDLSPAGLVYGDGAHTYKLIYLPPGVNDETPADAAKLLFPPPASKPRPRARSPSRQSLRQSLRRSRLTRKPATTILTPGLRWAP